MFFRGGRKFVLFVDKTMHVFARGGGNFELFWWTKKRVFQRGGFVVFFVNKNTHVFARGGGNFEVLCRKGNLLFRGDACICQRVAISNCSGGKRDMLFIGAAIMFC